MGRCAVGVQTAIEADAKWHAAATLRLLVFFVGIFTTDRWDHDSRQHDMPASAINCCHFWAALASRRHVAGIIVWKATSCHLWFTSSGVVPQNLVNTFPVILTILFSSTIGKAKVARVSALLF